MLELMISCVPWPLTGILWHRMTWHSLMLSQMFMAKVAEITRTKLTFIKKLYNHNGFRDYLPNQTSKHVSTSVYEQNHSIYITYHWSCVWKIVDTKGRCHLCLWLQWIRKNIGMARSINSSPPKHHEHVKKNLYIWNK